MNIEIKQLPKSEVELTIELTDLELEEYRLKALTSFSKEVKFPGFRPGKVPLEIVEQKMDPSFLKARTIDMAISPSYAKAVNQHNLKVITPPSVEILSTEPFKFKAVVAVYPEVKLKKSEFSINMEKIEVTEAEIEQEIFEIQKSKSKFEPKTDAVSMGDKVEIDFEGFDENGLPIEGTNSKNHPLILGDKSMVPGFEEEIVGLLPNQEKEFTITFPADYYHKSLQSKPVKFKVKLIKASKVLLPEVTPEFIKSVSGKDLTLEEFKEDLRKMLIDYKISQAKDKAKAELFMEIRNNTEVEFSDLLLKEECEAMLEDFIHSLSKNGLTFEKYLEFTKKNKEEQLKEYESEASNRLRLRFGLQEVFKQNNINISSEKLDQTIEEQYKFLTSPTKSLEELKTDYNLRIRLENQLKLEELFEKFIKS